MNDPIVVWPPGTFFDACSDLGWNYYDCTAEYGTLGQEGYVVCCPAW